MRTYDEFDEFAELMTEEEMDAEFSTSKNRSRAKRRKNDYKKAVRKRNKIHAYGMEWYDNLHQYSKNKIHCSCKMCKSKAYYGQHMSTIQEDKMADEEKDELKELYAWESVEETTGNIEDSFEPYTHEEYDDDYDYDDGYDYKMDAVEHVNEALSDISSEERQTYFEVMCELEFGVKYEEIKAILRERKENVAC